MPGLGPGIHEFIPARSWRGALFLSSLNVLHLSNTAQLVDARAKPWHDEGARDGTCDSVSRQCKGCRLPRRKLGPRGYSQPADLADDAHPLQPVVAVFRADAVGHVVAAVD